MDYSIHWLFTTLRTCSIISLTIDPACIVPIRISANTKQGISFLVLLVLADEGLGPGLGVLALLLLGGRGRGLAAAGRRGLGEHGGRDPLHGGGAPRQRAVAHRTLLVDFSGLDEHGFHLG